MKRQDLEHIIRAAAAVTDAYELIVVGSQAILGAVPDAPEELLVSQEADVYPKDRPEDADLIDGAIGEDSLFHERFGYYAQGVGPETARLPPGWQDRLFKVQSANTNLCIGWCLSPADICVSKLLAGREKDVAYVQVAIERRIVDAAVVQALLEMMVPADAAVQRALRLLARLRGRWESGGAPSQPVPRGG